jgi:hypothetical protein
MNDKGFVFVGLGFELCVWSLKSRHCTTWATPPVWTSSDTDRDQWNHQHNLVNWHVLPSLPLPLPLALPPSPGSGAPLIPPHLPGHRSYWTAFSRDTVWPGFIPWALAHVAHIALIHSFSNTEWDLLCGFSTIHLTIDLSMEGPWVQGQKEQTQET